MTSKQITIKLFYNLATQTFYIQLGGTCYQAPDKWILEIKKREGLQIRNVKDSKDMQEISNNDNSLPT